MIKLVNIFIVKPTKNGHQCQLPYRKESNLYDLYFCYRSLSNLIKCQTNNNRAEDQCQQGLLVCFLVFVFIQNLLSGKYQLLLLENVERREFITPKINGNANLTWLTFYYYLSRKDIVLLLTYYLNEEGERKLIGGFGNILFNGWHLARESFNPNSKLYQVFSFLNTTKNKRTKDVSINFRLFFKYIVLICPILPNYFMLVLIK